MVCYTAVSKNGMAEKKTPASSASVFGLVSIFHCGDVGRVVKIGALIPCYSSKVVRSSNNVVKSFDEPTIWAGL